MNSIVGNQAWNGGGLYAVAGNYYFDITDVLFDTNTALADGGAMLVITDHIALNIHQCSFIANEAESGKLTF